MIAIKAYLVLKMFSNKPRGDPATTEYVLLKDAEKTRDNVPQDTAQTSLLSMLLVHETTYLRIRERKAGYICESLLWLLSSNYCSASRVKMLLFHKTPWGTFCCLFAGYSEPSLEWNANVSYLVLRCLWHSRTNVQKSNGTNKKCYAGMRGSPGGGGLDIQRRPLLK